MFTVSEVYMNK